MSKIIQNAQTEPFQVTINFPEGEKEVKVVPQADQKFKVYDQEQLLGEVQLDEQHVCSSCGTDMEAAIIAQLGDRIKGFYL
ncbi:hypothetical protein HH214_15005 [Mucilaginibacter robiniae]|uniref:Uncharacterized protein n=1 Tax=Mucilaginibacter robiniae TaxID=2728022 RepID=A0A7L5E883_9SPHI|nr:hypothetical protein [Mucilaginibacter robiniae]QJD97083.1 hypothetical protein HH214_15005 [Mucilaginibacter robiniae]